MSHDALPDLINRLVRPDIQAMKAYAVADASNMIKLDAMENPYPWPEQMQAAWLDELKKAELNRYPDPAGKALCEQLRIAMKVPKGQDILLGNGSDEIIQILAMTLAKPDAKLMAFDPGFVMYKLIAEFVGMEYVGVPLNADDFSIDVEHTLAVIEQEQPALIFIAYPNNPTGNAFDPMVIDRIVELSKGLVVIDEAYQPFAEDTFMGRLGRHSNLLVMRTVSKFGLAGLRLGFLAGAPEWVTELNKVRLPYNINVLTQASVHFALRHEEVFAEQAASIRAERHRLIRKLSAMDGLTVFPSRANFVLFKAPNGQADTIFNELKAAGVLIKNLNSVGGVLADCLRVTVSTREENQHFIDAMSTILSQL